MFIENVIRTIANAAVNDLENLNLKYDIATRNLFLTYFRTFYILTDCKISIDYKRKHVTKIGGTLLCFDFLLGSFLLLYNRKLILCLFNSGTINKYYAKQIYQAGFA